MNFKLRLVALLLAALMCLTSCDALLGFINPTPTTSATEATKATTLKPTTPTTSKPADDDKWKRADHSLTSAELKAQYTLTREEVDATLALLDNMLEASKTATAEDTSEFDALYEQFDESFYHMAEQRTIATIIYYVDMSNEEATTRQEDATNMFMEVQDKYNIICRQMYLESPIRDILFEGWTEEEIQSLMEYDPVVMEIRKAINALEDEYNKLENGPDFTDKSAEIYAQIVVKNNDLADYYGYDNYYTFASENTYGREYDAEQLEVFKEYVVKYILPGFSNAYARYKKINSLSSSDKSFVNKFMNGKFDGMSTNYLVDYLDSLGDTTMGQSMRHMFENKNCVFSGKPNSHPTAFCTYLYESEQPFCLFGSSGQSSTTMVHEIGHYYAYLVNSDLDSYDLAETHSQSNEFLFLEYCQPQMTAEAFDVIYSYQLLNACYIIVMASIIDEFEQRVYALDSDVVATYTSADFDAIMEDVCKPYGGAVYVSSELADPFNFWRQVTTTSPVYYISYAVSAVAALEINALVNTDKEAAYQAYTTLAEDVTNEDGFIHALEIAGLSSPFEEETYIAIAEELKP